MDRVRFGRALGYGARHAARTLTEAAKAAAAPSAAPSSALGSRAAEPPAAAPSTRTAPLQQAGARVAEVHRAGMGARKQVGTQARQAGRSALAPLRRAGGVLWLELTGTIFALFALSMSAGLWKLRDSLHAGANSPEAHRLYVYALILGLFTYFAITSFVRAHRRGRRP